MSTATVHWTPSSPCGPPCLPDPRAVPLVARRRRCRRWVAGTVVLALGGPVVLLTPLLAAGPRRNLRRWWFDALLRAFGVRVVTRGGLELDTGGPAGTLVVSNHVSWLDVVALQALCPMRMLAKAEMRSWPVLGALAARAGTLFIERGSLAGLRPAVDRIAASLRSGVVVGVFPEGTTWCGRSAGRHRPAVFQAALDSGARVRPVALRFLAEDGTPTTAAAFVGSDTLLRSVAQVVRVRGLTVEVTALPAIEAVGDRRDLARRCSAAIRSVTGATDIDWTSTPVEVARSSDEHEERRHAGRHGQRCRTPRRSDGRPEHRQRPVESGAA